MSAISVIGLGKLGQPMAALYASVGHEVHGYDVEVDVMISILDGKGTVDEPGVDALIAQGRQSGNLTCMPTIHDAVQDTDVTFIIVPTPSDSDGVFANQYVLETVRQIGAALRYKDDWHVVVVCSTVMPGSTMGPIRAELERTSKRTVGEDVGLAYSPEFIALGSVIQDMKCPDMLLIGESDPRTGALVADLAKSVHDCSPPPVPPPYNQPGQGSRYRRPSTSIFRTTPTNAEIAKLGVNTFVTLKMSFANMLGQFCEALEADAIEVAKLVGADTRIGRKYLTPATPYGGPCFPRDTKAFEVMARQLSAAADLPVASDAVNRSQTAWIAHQVREFVDESGAAPRIVVLGLAYKAGTSVTDESFGRLLCDRILWNMDAEVVAYDPQAKLWEGVSGNVTQVDSIEEAFDTDRPLIAVVATDEKEFWGVEVSGDVIDCWGATEKRLFDDARNVPVMHKPMVATGRVWRLGKGVTNA